MKTTLDSTILDDPKQNLVTAFDEGEHDKALMKSERTIMDLPDVKDIPGQENVKVMPFGEIADVTISSDDEEGAGILNFDEDLVTDISEDDSVSMDAGEVDDDYDSDDEDEGFDDDPENDDVDADITREEIELLDESGPVEADSDTDNLNRSKLDNTDMEGEPLNEAGPYAGNDGSELDVAGAELDDENEAIGEEDEENNMYSVADTE